MKQTNLGKNGPEVSGVGLGCVALDPSYDPNINHEKIYEIFTDAVKWGITFFDSGDYYRLEGRLQILKPNRNHVIVATKFGYDYMNEKLNSDPVFIRESVEETLYRTGFDMIDLLYQWRVDPNIPIEVVAGTVKDLIQEGKVKYFGLCEPDPDTIRRAHAVLPLTAVQYHYSIWKPEIRILPLLAELGIAYVPFIKDEPTDKNPQLVELFARIAKEKRFTPAQIGLAWLMAHNSMVIPMAGAKRPETVDEFIGSLIVELSADEWKEIDMIVSPEKYPLDVQ